MATLPIAAAATAVAMSKPSHLVQRPLHLHSNRANSSLASAPNVESNTCLESISASRRRFCNLGVGFLASSLLVSAPLDANATRIEYFATVAEPSCDLNFVKSGLGYCDVAVGTGVEAPFGELINVHYTARFDDGTVFDSSYKRARPLTMRIGVGKLIKGLDQGIFGGGGVPPMHMRKPAALMMSLLVWKGVILAVCRYSTGPIERIAWLVDIGTCVNESSCC
ncbi:hypothetical protein ACLOJK_013205 [Asimina triloba]